MLPEPIASGAFDKTPFAHLLIYLDQKQLSGTLAVWPESSAEGESENQDRILFLKGRPVAGRLVEPAASLREGLLRLFTRVQAPYAFYEKNLLGDDRLNGRVDPLALVTESLRSVARNDVIETVLGRLGEARLRVQLGVDLKRYAFDREERGLVELLQAEPMALAAIVDGAGLSRARARRLMYLLVISKAVAPYDEEELARARAARASGEHMPVMPPVPAAGEPAASVSGPGAAAARATGEHAPVPGSAGSARATGEHAGVASGAVGARKTGEHAPVVPDAAGAAGGGAGTRPEQPPASRLSGAKLHGRLDRLAAVPPMPGSLSQEFRDRWQRIVTKARLIENENYFEMLGLDREAKAADAKTKFFQLAKEWHPDRLPKALAPLRPYCEVVFGYMSEAHAALENEEGRKQYLQTLREGGGTPASDNLMQRILDGAMEFERVLILSRQNQFEEAIRVLERILSVTADDPDHHAHYAWLLMKGFPGDDAPYDRMLSATKRALKLSPDHEKANLYTAQILRRMGKGREALQFFKKVAEKNPRNVEAARELRVASFRADGGARSKDKEKDKGGSGFFGKLFGKKE
jgi:tetratricopeptide (TPR) repeat protein